jgi:uncharacterized RDD family membrane protein YckC
MQDREFTGPTGETGESRVHEPVGGALAKADLTKRFLAALIDGVLAGIVSLVPAVGGLVAAAYLLLRDGFDLEFMDRRSLGKKVMKLRPVLLDGQPMDLVASAKRNWMFALGGITALLAYIPILGWLLMVPVALAALVLGIIEIVLVVTDAQGRRVGDKIAGSQVVEAGS